MAKIELVGVSKVFGPDRERARELAVDPRTRTEIIADTGYVAAVRDVNISIEAGELFVVMGLSGSGKSTLIRCINRLHEPTTGKVIIDGEDIMTYSEEQLRQLRRTKMAMVFQHFGLFPHRTVAENAQYGLRMQGIPQSERVPRAERALELVGLKGWGDRKPGDLSGGMQQRVGLARALATDADILLMDEAFSALDPLIRREMQDELLKIQRELGKTIVFITHDLNEALKLGDRTAIMRDGVIVQMGSADQIVSEPSNDYVLEFTRDVDRSRVLTIGSVMRRPDRLEIEKDTIRTASARLRAADEDYMMLVDRGGYPIGLVIDEDVQGAVSRGETDLKAIARPAYATVKADELLLDVYEAATSGRCLVVVDDDGRLEGVAEPLDLIASLTPPAAVEDGSGGVEFQAEAAPTEEHVNV